MCRSCPEPLSQQTLHMQASSALSCPHGKQHDTIQPGALHWQTPGQIRCSSLAGSGCRVPRWCFDYRMCAGQIHLSLMRSWTFGRRFARQSCLGKDHVRRCLQQRLRDDCLERWISGLRLIDGLSECRRRGRGRRGHVGGQIVVLANRSHQVMNYATPVRQGLCIGFGGGSSPGRSWLRPA